MRHLKHQNIFDRYKSCQHFSQASENNSVHYQQLHDCISVSTYSNNHYQADRKNSLYKAIRPHLVSDQKPVQISHRCGKTHNRL